MQLESTMDSLLLSIYNKSSVKDAFQGIQYVGRPFIEMVQDTPYIDVMDDPTTTYSVYLDKTNFHWFILLKQTNSQLPYITLEISTLNLTDLLTVMKVMGEKECGKVVHLGYFCGKLSKFCLTADKIRLSMGQYRLLQSNCQHFCNNLTHQYGMEVRSPTGTYLLNVPTLTIVDTLQEESRQAAELQVAKTQDSDDLFSHAPEVVQKNAAKAYAVFAGVRGYDDMVRQIDSRHECEV